MTTYNGRAPAKGGKPVFVQKGAKGKLASPSTGSQSGFSSSGPAPQQPSSATKETVISEHDQKHMHDRMLFLLTNMIGMTVEVTVKNGSKFEGLFHTAFTEGELGIVLCLAKATAGKDKKENAPLISQMIIMAKDCMGISVSGLDFVPHDRIGSERGEREGFKTDTDISRSGDIRERDLKKWAPEEHTSLGGIEDDLGDSHMHSNNTSWDQFAANERLFGVRTDFDEEIYTTKLDRSGADYKAREQQAIQIANEIQQSTSTNVHMQEERGLSIDDSGMDEEDRYGAVVRAPTVPQTNKYIPPAVRRQQELNQRRPSTPSQQQQQQAQAQVQVQAQQKQEPHTQPVVVKASVQPMPAPSQKPTLSESTSVTKPEPTPTPATTTPKRPLNNALNDLRKHNPMSSILDAATIQGSKNQKIPDHAVDSKQIEDNLAKFAETARTFASNDKALVEQTKLDLSQRRTEIEKEERRKEQEKRQRAKEGLAADLKEFGKFINQKLTGPVPDDVKEIFGKRDNDKAKEAAKAAEKVAEVAKAEAAKAEAAKATATPASTTTATSATTAATVTTATTEKPADKPAASGSNFKFNIKASVFKPNVNAPVFTPSGSLDKKLEKNLFLGKAIKKGPLSLQDSMSSPFKKSQTTPAPTSITPTWPYGERSFRHLFLVTSRYEEEMYGQGQHGPGGYYAVNPYSYPPGQFAGGPPMSMAPGHIPFMGTGHVPFTQPMAHTGGGPGFPQMAPTSAPHYTQGYPAPGRTGMIAPAGMQFPMYYPPNPHGGPVMMRYPPPPPDMMPPMGPNGMMMHQRPMGMDPMMHYPTGGRESGPSEERSPEVSNA
ncbi:hypothetical protein CPC16_003601 [Podila verticillata]|nr:hypothetical protein CPC16_003601 [Podila verticillata]